MWGGMRESCLKVIARCCAVWTYSDHKHGLKTRATKTLLSGVHHDAGGDFIDAGVGVGGFAAGVGVALFGDCGFELAIDVGVARAKFSEGGVGDQGVAELIGDGIE